MIRRTFLVAAAVASVLAVTPAHADRALTRQYVGGSALTCTASDAGLVGEVHVNVGGACFRPRSGETLVDVSVDDQVDGRVAFSVHVAFEADGSPGAHIADGCGSIDAVPIPPETQIIFVNLETDADCGHIGTIGTISATLR